MPAYLEPAMPSILSGIVLMIVGGVGGWLVSRLKNYKKDHEAMMEMRESFTEFMQEHKTLMLAVKNINRATILDMCERATRRGFISDNNFKCLCELEESYHRLHGNSYTDEIIEKTKLMYKNQTIHSIEQLPQSID